LGGSEQVSLQQANPGIIGGTTRNSHGFRS